MEFAVREPGRLVEELDERTQLISLLRDIALASEAGFEDEYLAPIRQLASWFLELPASPEHHSDPGGLLRHAVQSGYFALRLAEGAVFGGGLPAERRRVVDRESRRAAFLAALASPVALPHRFLIVSSPDGEVWSEFSSPAPLAQWAGERGGGYRIGWRHAPSPFVRSVAVWLAGNLLAPHWGAMSRDVMLGAMASVAPEDKPQGQETPLQKIVRQALAKSAEAAKRCAATQYVPPESMVVPTKEQLMAQASPPATQQPAKAPEPAAAPEQEAAPPATGGQRGTEPAQSELRLPGGSPANPLGGLSPTLRELLEALAEDIKHKEAVRRRVSWDETGNWLLVDTNLLGAYGMSANGVASALRKAKVAEDGNGRSLRIVETVGQLLLPRAA